MASRAVGCGADVITIFARGGLAIVATGAVGCTGKGAVVGLGTAPGAC